MSTTYKWCSNPAEVLGLNFMGKEPAGNFEWIGRKKLRIIGQATRMPSVLGAASFTEGSGVDDDSG